MFHVSCLLESSNSFTRGSSYGHVTLQFPLLLAMSIFIAINSGFSVFPTPTFQFFYWPGTNSSVSKLLLLIYWWGKNNQRKITTTLIQTVCPNRVVLHAGKQGARSADVGVMAPVFEKSATEFKLKPKPKLLRRKNTIHITTFNVRTLNTFKPAIWADSVCSKA